ncbi:MORN repeat-containing protein 4 [Holothuria leucospilota]|uniref:MORN repeat-containing protein 4 n=1 Tax=Holothuria leucospilota TaxID=206669 RepID=A0A9Q0YS24_HOLLE|nr:MORN repeat-containing protein 4 [Holothuria leucospilota]
MARRAVYTYPDGEEYKGDWVDGKKQGLGQLTSPDGIQYTGGFDNGLFNDYGVLVFPDGSRYEGQFVGGKFEGHGVFRGAQGMVFEGEFRQGKVSGKGIITFPNGEHGLPRREGIFEGTRLVERMRCSETIELARQAAANASSIKVEM